MDFLIHYRIQDENNTERLLNAMRLLNALVYQYEGTILARYQPVDKKGLIAHLQEALYAQTWAEDDFLLFYFPEQGNELNCWIMKRADRTRMIRIGPEHPFFRI